MMPVLQENNDNKEHELHNEQFSVIDINLCSFFILRISYLSGTNSWANKINRKINEPRMCVLFQNICDFPFPVLKPEEIILPAPSNSSTQCLK